MSGAFRTRWIFVVLAFASGAYVIAIILLGVSWYSQKPSPLSADARACRLMPTHGLEAALGERQISLGGRDETSHSTCIARFGPDTAIVVYGRGTQRRSTSLRTLLDGVRRVYANNKSLTIEANGTIGCYSTATVILWEAAADSECVDLKAFISLHVSRLGNAPLALDTTGKLLAAARAKI